MAELTTLLNRYRDGDPEVRGELYEAVYSELRSLAKSYMSRERRGHTLQPTALIHEAYQRIDGLHQIDWRSRGHFLAVAAIQMERVLIDYARSREAIKHGGGKTFVAIDGFEPPAKDTSIEVVELREVLGRLEERDKRLATVIRYRIYSGMTFDQIAESLEISERTARSDWKFGKTWLQGQLRPQGTR